MSDYILSALFTNLDKPGLYANNKRIMTWQEFVAAGFSNSQVTRLVVPSLNSYANATINCPNLTEIYGDPTIARIKFSNLPSALKTVEGDATYLNVNQNPHYLLIDVDTTTTNSLTVHDDCVAIGAFVGAGSSNSQVSPSLTIPAGVKCIGPYAFGTPFYQTINVVGNDDLEIGTDSTTCFDVTLSGALPPEWRSNCPLTSLTIGNSKSVNIFFTWDHYYYPSKASPLSSISIKTSKLRGSIYNTNASTGYSFFDNLSSITLEYKENQDFGKESISPFSVDNDYTSSHTVTSGIVFKPTKISYTGTWTQYMLAYGSQSKAQLSCYRIDCSDGSYYDGYFHPSN